jgi:hypothetical protein
MAPQPLTQAAVNKVSTTTRTLIADGGCRGLYVDVRPNGKTYRYRYTDHAGQFRGVTIGDASLLKLSEARDRLRELARRVALGEDLQKKPEPAQSAPLSFGEFVAGRYIPHAKLTKRGLHGELSLLKTHILPALSTRPLSAISKGDITAFVHGKLAEGYAPGTVNRMLNLVKAIFSRGVEWEIGGLEKNPAHGVKQLPDPNRKERFLTARTTRCSRSSPRSRRSSCATMRTWC